MTGDRNLDETRNLSELTRDELIELLQGQAEPGIRINFSGKAQARRLYRQVRPRLLREIKKYSCGDEDARARNLVVEGDNLQTMVTLYRERGQVDLIVADPPYNTGNDWRYNDKWETDPNDTGLGDFVRGDDGARHTKWMRFMWPRLALMKSMLKPGGVLAICIDFRELFRLGQMLDEKEMFGEGNRLGIINWQRTYSPSNDKGHVATTTEYVLLYAKDREQTVTRRLPRTAAHNSGYGSPDGDPRDWDDGPSTASNAAAHKGMVYGIQNPFTGKVLYPPAGSSWRHEQPRILEWLKGWGCEYRLRDLNDAEKRAQIIGVPPTQVPKVKGIVFAESKASARKKAEAVYETGPWPRFIFLSKGRGRPRVKRYLDEVKRGIVPTTFWLEDFKFPHELGPVTWPHQESGHSEQGVDELTAVVGKGHEFKTVKPLRLFQKIIQIWCPPDGLVLDPFAGSGTTGHAVLALNRATDANRRFILIEQGRPERGDAYARSLLADRLQRVITGDWAAGPAEPLGSGYRFATLDKRVDADALLNMEREEMAETVIFSHFDAGHRRGVGLSHVEPAQYRYLVAHNSDEEGFFLVWDGANGNTNFTEEVYEECAAEAARAKLKPRYHVYARLYLFQTTNVVFYQIPDRILRDFGLDLRGEPFTDDGPA